MNSLERRATLALAGVFSLRMLGMFLILPVFVLYAEGLRGATPALMGLALGIYGLTQGLLQIPAGWLSDRFGRKPVITLGLVRFAAGSVVAALAPDMAWTITGRALQGAGAVAAVLTALLADLTRDTVRTRAMAVVGITIGSSFGLSLVLGPVLDAWFGVRGIFWLTALLAIGAIGVVWAVVPADSGRAGRVIPKQAFRGVLVWPLVKLDVGIFALHFVLTAIFVAVPFALLANPSLAGIPAAWVYLPVLLVSVALMVPFVLVGDRPGWQRPLAIGSVGVLLASLVVLAGGHGTLWGLLGGLVVFFTAFNFLEASLPATVSKAAPGSARGAALGVYSSCQFLGTFAGGLAGGFAWGLGGNTAVFVVAAAMAAIWLALTLKK